MLLVAAIGVIVYITVLPVLNYFYDRKCLRKYPNSSPLSGLTNLRYVYLSSCGYRSRDLYESKVTALPAPKISTMSSWAELIHTYSMSLTRENMDASVRYCRLHLL